MINNTMHDEIKYKGKPLIIDTCDLGNLYNEPFETMALRPGGDEVECVRSATLEDAQRVHRLMLARYKEQEEAPRPLTARQTGGVSVRTWRNDITVLA